MESTAVFWDRDGTLIEDPGYLSDPDQVKLLPGVADALRRTKAAGYLNIIVTNQSGIARGLFDEPTLERIHERLKHLLSEQGTEIDAIYYCPYLTGDEAVVEEYRRDSDLRKPQPGMLVKASLEHGIELAGSWMVGDGPHDMQAGRAAGCRTVLLSSKGGRGGKNRESDFTATSASEAADTIIKHTPKAQPKASPAPARADASTDAAAGVQEILTFLKMVDRRQQTRDFSLWQLAGVIAQIFAIGATIWTIFGVLRQELPSVQIVRLGFAILFQMMTMTFFLMGSRK